MKIGIIGAMEEEVKNFIDSMEVKNTTKKAGMTFYEGNLCGKDVVVVRSGIGKVNMAICTQILIDLYEVTQLINTGIAGGLYQDIRIGDIVISSDSLQHDMDATGFGYDLGVIPRMEHSIFKADEKLAKLAKEVCEEVNPDIQCFIGRIVSGDQFISDSKKKEELIQNFAGYCAEMEGAAMAQVAHNNQVPYIVVRAISDQADDQATMDYPTFEKLAIKHMVRLIKGILDKE